MSKSKSYEGREAVEPRFTQYGKRKGEPVCQSRNQGGRWKGHPCGNAAKHGLVYPGFTDEDGCVFPGRTAEVCCGAHIAQALSRNPGAGVEDLDWQPEEP